MSLFRSRGTDGAKSDGKPPNTISNSQWSSVRKAAASQVDYVEGPWTTPERAARKRVWSDSSHARDN